MRAGHDMVVQGWKLPNPPSRKVLTKVRGQSQGPGSAARLRMAIGRRRALTPLAHAGVPSFVRFQVWPQGGAPAVAGLACNGRPNLAVVGRGQGVGISQGAPQATPG